MAANLSGSTVPGSLRPQTLTREKGFRRTRVTHQYKLGKNEWKIIILRAKLMDSKNWEQGNKPKTLLKAWDFLPSFEGLQKLHKKLDCTRNRCIILCKWKRDFYNIGKEKLARIFKRFNPVVWGDLFQNLMKAWSLLLHWMMPAYI